MEFLAIFVFGVYVGVAIANMKDAVLYLVKTAIANFKEEYSK